MHHNISMPMFTSTRSFLILFILIYTARVHAQLYTTGEVEAGLEWREIETGTFTLVYDTAFEKQAQRLAAILDYSLPLAGNTLRQRPLKLPVLVRNHNSISNGMVAWVPKRMELYTVPPPDLETQGWYESLTIHEARHAAQMHRFYRNPANIFSYFFGEQTYLLPIAQVPAWFYEGDAVVTETALTRSGRGRLPSFEMEIRAHLLDGNAPYHYRKAVNGSFKDYVPDHYRLGYLMVAYNRVKYGPQLWEQAVNKAGRTSFFHFWPFLSSIKRQTGYNRRQLYENTMDALYTTWNEQWKNINFTEYYTVNKRKSNTYTLYTSPQLYNGKVYALKTGLDNITQIVEIDAESGSEKVVLEPGHIFSQRFSMHGPNIYFDELKQDLRWPGRNFSLIRQYNVETKHNRYLSRKSRYFSPAPSANGLWLAVYESTPAGIQKLVILDSKNGDIIKSFELPLNSAIQNLCWDEGSEHIISTRVDENGKSLSKINITTGAWENLIEPGFENISTPVSAGKFIYFNATYSGIDNIYALNTENKEIMQVTSAPHGAFEPFFDANNNALYYSNYTSRGNDIVYSKLNTGQWQSLNQIKKFDTGLAEKLAAQEPEKFNPSEIVYKNYPSKPYSKLKNALQIHSWKPFYIYSNPGGPTESAVMPGAAFSSQNLHSNVIAQGGAGIYKDRIFSNLNISYTGLFPVFSANIFYGDSINYINDKKLAARDGRLIEFTGSAAFPFNFSQGSMVTGFTPTALYRYENRYYQTTQKNGKRQGLNRYGISATFYTYKHYTAKHLTPYLGFAISAGWYSPIMDDYFSDQQFIQSAVYLPGLFKHNTIKLKAAFENQNPGHYLASSILGPVRGWYDEWEKQKPGVKNMAIFSAGYFLPLAYPDLRLLKVIYLKRLKSQLFYDFAKAKVFNTQQSNTYASTYYNTYQSYGIEALADFRIFSIPGDITLGARISKIDVSARLIPEFIFGLGY